MKGKGAAETIGVILGTITVFIIVFPLLIAASAYIGYFFGIIVMWLAGGVLTDLLGVDAYKIPAVMAWMFVAASLLGGGLRAGGDK